MSTLKATAKIVNQNTWFSNRLMGWMGNNLSGAYVESDREALFIGGLLGPGNDNRSAAWHPSSLLRCPRAQVFEYAGVVGRSNIDHGTRMFFVDGVWRHARWQLIFMKSGLADEVEVRLEDPKLQIQGSADAIKTGEYGIEIKGTSQLGIIEREGKPIESHIAQAQMYMHLSGLTDWIIFYEDKAFQRWKDFPLTYDKDYVAYLIDIIQRMRLAIGSDDLMTVPPLKECESATGPTFNGCAYKHVCLESQTPRQAVVMSQVDMPKKKVTVRRKRG